MSMWSQSAPESSMRWVSEAKLAKSEESMEGAILGVTPIFLCFLSRLTRTQRRRGRAQKKQSVLIDGGCWWLVRGWEGSKVKQNFPIHRQLPNANWGRWWWWWLPLTSTFFFWVRDFYLFLFTSFWRKSQCQSGWALGLLQNEPKHVKTKPKRVVTKRIATH